MDIFSETYNILVDLDSKFISIVFLSLYISLLATIIASIVSIYVSSLLVLKNFIGKSFVLLVIGLICITAGYVNQIAPQCKKGVEVKIVPRNVYDQMIKDSVLSQTD